MFFSKKSKEVDKLILGDESRIAFNNGSGEINVKITSKDQLFSSYSYSGDKLNSEFSDYVFEKAKSVPVKETVKIKIHTDDEISADEVKQIMQNHYRATYKETKQEIKRNGIVCLIMTILGILALTALILINHFTDNLYITSIVEIAAWVFIWETVDNFFLQRPLIKARCILIQRIYMSEIEICKITE